MITYYYRISNELPNGISTLLISSASTTASIIRRLLFCTFTSLRVTIQPSNVSSAVYVSFSTSTAHAFLTAAYASTRPVPNRPMKGAFSGMSYH